MRKVESVVVAALLVALAVFVIVESRVSIAPKTAYTVYGEKDASEFPLILGIILLIMAALNLFHALRSAPDTREEDAIRASLPEHERSPSGIRALVIRSWAFFALAGLFAVSMEYLGFVIATVLFLSASFFLLGSRNWLMLTAGSLGITLTVQFVFTDVLNLILPRGVII
ncbi:tripartite tricarboxylate transporter TctB family protein [Desulfovibrio sp. OttesenSCG-928-I05]|nr:tripartite tricarboxylate transporter TctB family protein [Desulfovibrio sp. OttesenSCG-928-I05]